MGARGEGGLGVSHAVRWGNTVDAVGEGRRENQKNYVVFWPHRDRLQSNNTGKNEHMINDVCLPYVRVYRDHPR